MRIFKWISELRKQLLNSKNFCNHFKFDQYKLFIEKYFEHNYMVLHLYQVFVYIQIFHATVRTALIHFLT